MESTIHVYGRGGDIVVSMFAADLVNRHLGVKPTICVYEGYCPLVDAMTEHGMPISGSMEMTIPPLFSDDRIFGSSIYPLSELFFRNAFGEIGRHFNCCLGNIPSGTHIGGMMRYSTGLCGSSSLDGIEYPLVERSASINDKIVYHMGSSTAGRAINMPICPFPEMESVFVGLGGDHVEPWCDRDMRGAPIGDVFTELKNSRACIGSDSMITHISAALSVPTVAIHKLKNSIVMADRGVYGDHSFSVQEKGETFDLEVIRGILSRFFHESKSYS